jgi:hypothetical protein
MKFYEIIVSTHSILRWFLLIVMLITLFIYFRKWQKDIQYFKPDRVWFSLTLNLLHIQLIVGILLYFISPKVHFSSNTLSTGIFRFYTIEHSFMMIAAVVALTIGSIKIKRIQESVLKFKTGFWYLLLTLVFLLIGIPWPFYGKGVGWI